MADQYPITLAEFRAWLETKRPTAVVGRRMHGVGCPIGCYLTARGDEFDVVVPSTILVSPGIYKQTPPWAYAFIRLVDGSGAYHTNIQARTALRLLDRAAHASLPAEELDHEHLSLELEAVNE